MANNTIDVCAWCPDNRERTRMIVEAGHVANHVMCPVCVKRMNDELEAKEMMTLFVAGDRVRLRRDVERYPFFVARKGMTGVITVVEPNTIIVKLDDPLCGAQDWNNSVYWEKDFTLEDVVADLELLEARS